MSVRAHLRQRDASLPSNWRDEPPEEVSALLQDLLHKALPLSVLLPHLAVAILHLHLRPRIELVTLQQLRPIARFSSLKCLLDQGAIQARRNATPWSAPDHLASLPLLHFPPVCGCRGRPLSSQSRGCGVFAVFSLAGSQLENRSAKWRRSRRKRILLSSRQFEHQHHHVFDTCSSYGAQRQCALRPLSSRTQFLNKLARCSTCPPCTWRCRVLSSSALQDAAWPS